MPASGSTSAPFPPEYRNSLVEGIAALPAELRQVVVLRDVEGLSCATIAALVGCPVSTVKSRINQARLQLYRTLRERSADLLSSPESISPLPVSRISS